MVKFEVLRGHVKETHNDEYQIPIKVIFERSEMSHFKGDVYNGEKYEELESEFNDLTGSEEEYRTITFREENGLVVRIQFKEEEIPNLKEIVNSVTDKLKLAMKNIEEQEKRWAEQKEQRKLTIEAVKQQVKSIDF